MFSSSEEEEELTRGDEGRGRGGGRGGGESVDLPAVVPFSSADEESLEGRVAPSAPDPRQTSVSARVRLRHTCMIVYMYMYMYMCIVYIWIHCHVQYIVFVRIHVHVCIGTCTSMAPHLHCSRVLSYLIIMHIRDNLHVHVCTYKSEIHVHVHVPIAGYTMYVCFSYTACMVSGNPDFLTSPLKGYPYNFV